MKKLIMLLPVLLIGCGQGFNEIKGSFKTPTKKLQEGSYLLQDSSGQISGPIELTFNSENRVDVSVNGELRSKNYNNTYGLHPRFSGHNLQVFNGGTYVTYARDIEYNNRYDIEKDNTTEDLSNGKHYTVHEVYLDDQGTLTLEITIYSGSSRDSGDINYIVVNRMFKALE